MPVHRNNRTLGDGSAEAGDAGAGASRSPIRLRQLRCFLAATDHGSFRKAATALTINESSVSRQIRNLEDELGASLFLRHSAGVRLTVAGQEFLRSARGREFRAERVILAEAAFEKRVSAVLVFVLVVDAVARAFRGQCSRSITPHFFGVIGACDVVAEKLSRDARRRIVAEFRLEAQARSV